MPVGYKNTTEGNLQPALDAFAAAHEPHRFLGIDEDGRTAIVTTRGNAAGHLILRGGRERPNYDPRRVAEAIARLEAAGLPAAAHGGLQPRELRQAHERQQVVWSSAIEQRAAATRSGRGDAREQLVEGRQDLPPTPRAALRRLDHRRLHRLGGDGGACQRARSTFH
jgi:3-deoxy-7-phosphoheptulonate synthase